MNLAIAENYSQFRAIVKDKWSQFKYLGSLPEDIRGRANCTLYLMGRWYARRDFTRHEDSIRCYCAVHSITIETIEEFLPVDFS